MCDLVASKFCEIIQNGMLEADKTYLDWTGGWGITDGGIEGFVTSWIAKHLVEKTRILRGPKGGYAALELTLDRLANDLSPDDQGAHFRGMINKACEENADTAISLRKKSRIDLVFYDGWWPGNTGKLRPRGIVEVKRWLDKSTYPKDMRRIRCLLDTFGPSKGGSLLYGCFIFCLIDPSNKSIEAAVEKIGSLQELIGPFRVERTPVVSADGTPVRAASIAVVFETDQ